MLSVLCLCASLTGVMTSPADAARKHSGWELHESSRLTGAYTMEIAPDALKIINLTTNVFYVMKAPSWRVYVCNPSRKTYCATTSTDLEESQLVKLFLLYRTDLMRAHWHSKPTSSFQGLRCVEATTDKMHLDVIRDRTQRLGPGVYQATLVQSTEMKVPPVMSTVLDKVYILPPVTGIPVTCFYLTLSGMRKNVFGTDSVSKRVFDDSEFEVPKGFTLVAVQRRVTGDTTGGAVLEDLTEFFTKEKGSKDQHRKGSPYEDF